MNDQDCKTDIESLSTQLAHWKAFAKHAEGERSAWVLHSRANEGQRRALADEVSALTVRSDADRVLHESEIQLLFQRAKPLRADVSPVDLYGPNVRAKPDGPAVSA